MARVVRVLWIVLAVSVLAVTLVKFDGRPNSDIGDFLVLTMLVLTVPAGFAFALLAAGAYSVLNASTGATVPTSYLTLLLEWGGFFLFGYLQWFVFVPWLIRRMRARSSTRSVSAA